ncbi:aminopeptidase P putativemetallo-peptidase Clan MG Family M24 [Trypanosoma cruzi]|uniref:Xaa-Pro dipeptidase n=2 Tax=Trypanosoma cruzi TaxID=5693 RepID=Q4DFX9_TRYCC|nr:aminopeptidase P, putative [Trypanosoma cruzi]EAN91437.1 aminopeptidase P, putative [Trypanosoma cruzi]RNC49981.1 aminopeptidase P putativemetallo-peptidase Clan MG Family M24 [Trypanosoma cruzi]|eukprot:XP_813288.1 aminopeptidase P [Trypanosoma cruzi strain CL Brener]
MHSEECYVVEQNTPTKTTMASNNKQNGHKDNACTAYPFKVKREMYREQRQRLAAALLSSKDATHAAFLQGGSEVPVNSSDINYLFWQESYFAYLFGCDIPDSFGAVLADGKGLLFIPRYPVSYAVWMGELPTPESVKLATGLEEVYYTDEIEAALTSKGVQTVEVLDGVNSDSGLHVLTAKLPEGSKVKISNKWLFGVLTQQRCHKTDLEAELLQYVCRVSSEAHIHVMQHCKPGMSQHHLESTFLHYVYYHGGCRKVAYTCICGTGHHGAVLHYPNNDAPVEDGSMALLDMGGHYMGYASDITCSFPVNGKFTEDQRIIYNAVLDAHDSVMRQLKPGVNWVDMHKLALRVMCEHLVRAGILLGDVDTIMRKRVMGLFQPHGLGHLMGMDVHDVGGYLEGCPPRPEESDCCKLRMARVLEKGFCLTVEPGCYINRTLLTDAFQNPEFKPHLNEAKLRSLWNFGGVRIESDVLITETGAINMTLVPRTVEEVEKTMAGAPFSREPEVFTH